MAQDKIGGKISKKINAHAEEFETVDFGKGLEASGVQIVVGAEQSPSNITNRQINTEVKFGIFVPTKDHMDLVMVNSTTSNPVSVKGKTFSQIIAPVIGSPQANIDFTRKLEAATRIKPHDGAL